MQTIDPITLADKIISLLDSTKYVATYKWASLDAMIQLISESVSDSGGVPISISGKEVGTRVMEIYWRQSVSFKPNIKGEPTFLRQSSTGRNLDIPQIIAKYRIEKNLTAKNDSLDRQRQRDQLGITKLEREIQARVIGQPLSKLQRFGNGSKSIEDRFLYDFSWKDEESFSKIHKANFDDSIRFRPGVAEGLLRIQSLLRPYLENLWIQKVASMNRELTDAANLEEFLFGTKRITHARIRPLLVKLQNKKCFYCEKEPVGTMEVDHFLPFSKHRNEALDNLIASCRACNGSKSDSYASPRHLIKWSKRFTPGLISSELDSIAESTGYLRKSPEILNTARSVYFFKPEGLLLWDQKLGSVALLHGECHSALDGLLL